MEGNEQNQGAVTQGQTNISEQMGYTLQPTGTTATVEDRLTVLEEKWKGDMVPSLTALHAAQIALDEKLALDAEDLDGHTKRLAALEGKPTPATTEAVSSLDSRIKELEKKPEPTFDGPTRAEWEELKQKLEATGIR